MLIETKAHNAGRALNNKTLFDPGVSRFLLSSVKLCQAYLLANKVKSQLQFLTSTCRNQVAHRSMPRTWAFHSFIEAASTGIQFVGLPSG